MLNRKNWANWPTISQLLEAYDAFCGCSGSRLYYKGDGVFIEEYYVMRRWGGELECDVDTAEIAYLDVYKCWLAYNQWKKAGKPIPTPATEVANDDAVDLPF